MAGYSAARAAFTPSATQNCLLDADTAGDYGKITKVTWGGELTASTAARTRWVRPTTIGSSSFTSLTPTSVIQHANQPQNTSRCVCGTYAGAPAVPAAPEGLFGISWNKHGGGGIYSATQPDEEWVVVNTGTVTHQQISCVQDQDITVTSMSTSMHWKED